MLKELFMKLKNPENRANLLLRIASRYINPWLRKLGMTLVVHHFYQPIPDDTEIALYAHKKRAVDKIAWNIEGQLAFTEQLLAEFSAEFNKRDNLKAFGYDEADGTFGCGSREFYYAMIRKHKPAQIIEIGAGNSSLICLAALRKNYEETGVKANFTSIEPFPSQKISRLAGKNLDFVNFRLISDKLQTLDPSLFQKLGFNDILFVDSSHVFKQGSDVEYEFLRIYPYLHSGVIVHIHDIFCPFDYPETWNRKYFHFWNEQYHLETFLMCNERFEVLAGLCMLNHEDAELFFRHIRGYKQEEYSGSFWMKVRDSGLR